MKELVKEATIQPQKDWEAFESQLQKILRDRDKFSHLTELVELTKMRNHLIFQFSGPDPNDAAARALITNVVLPALEKKIKIHGNLFLLYLTNATGT